MSLTRRQPIAIDSVADHLLQSVVDEAAVEVSLIHNGVWQFDEKTIREFARIIFTRTAL